MKTAFISIKINLTVKFGDFGWRFVSFDWILSCVLLLAQALYACVHSWHALSCLCSPVLLEPWTQLEARIKYPPSSLGSSLPCCILGELAQLLCVCVCVCVCVRACVRACVCVRV